MGREVEPALWAVAGCLFEVSMPEGNGSTWQVADPPAGITLLGEYVDGDERHFRFRAEADAAAAAQVSLRFRSLTEARGMVLRSVVVRVAPEAAPA